MKSTNKPYPLLTPQQLNNTERIYNASESGVKFDALLADPSLMTPEQIANLMSVKGFPYRASGDLKSRVNGSGGSFEGESALISRLQNDINMNLYDKITWGLTGNGVGAGKIFALKPTDGSKDPAFTRALSAYRTNSAGILELVDSGKPRFDYSLDSVDPALLFELSRINSFLNSETIVTQDVTVTAQSYTVSFWGTGTITFSGAYSGSLVGTGASNRVTLTFTPTAGTVTCTVTGTVTRGQFEAGSYATTYIPTTGSAVTRPADKITTITSAAHLIGQTEGTILLHASAADKVATYHKPILTIYGNSSNYLNVRFRTNGVFEIIGTKNGSVFAIQNGSTVYNANQFYKIGVRYKEGDCSFWLDGVKLSSKNEFTGWDISIDKIAFSDAFGGDFFAGSLKFAGISNVGLSEGVLQAFTTP